jgi:exodeoxyribonuclease V alpha subunit
MSVRALVRLFEAAKISFNLMAPTGIAAKRLAHVTGHPASTIHRALGYDGVEWKHGPNNRFITDAVIVDEVSMVDQELCYRLLSSLQDSTMLVFVGDDAQLPSVGPGNVLRELVACKDVPSIRLTKIFRQSQGGDIVSNSHLINQGDFPVLGNPKDNTEFGYICLSEEEKILSYIVRMARRLKDRDANFQVLTPKYDGVVGVNSLNSALRDILNPEGPPEWKGKHQHFRLGDRLMIIKNNYQKGIYNGDVGKLLYTGNDRLVVRVYGVGNNMDQEVAFTAGEAETYLRLAYAITVHKSQGSEFDTILMPVVNSQGRMLQRNLLYTAVTRAKKKVWLLGEESAIRRAIANNKVVSRNTVFADAISGVIGKSEHPLRAIETENSV